MYDKDLIEIKTKEYQLGYQQGKTETISEMRKLEQEHYCPCEGTDCCYKYSDESCITCYLDEIEGKVEKDE